MSSGGGAKPKTKKNVRHVPSRYLQVPEKSSSSEKSSSLVKSSDESMMSFNYKLGGKMTSTPMCKGLSGDSLMTIPSIKDRMMPSTSADLVKKSQLKKKIDKKGGDSFDQKIAEAEVDLLYASYLQSAFLVSESKKALEERTSAAVKTLHKLLALVHEYLRKAKSEKDFLNVLNFLIEVHTHCKKQEEMLRPVFEVIPTLEKQYKSLAEAINTTKHNLRVKDVQLPDANSEVEIQKTLEKMSEFIAAFFEAMPHHRDFQLSTEDLKKYSDAAELLADCLKRGVNLFTEAKDLCLSEAFYTL